MATAKFYRNVHSYEELKELTDCKNGLINQYEIIGVIALSEAEFVDFGSNICKHYSFLNPYLQDSNIQNNIFKCILIKCENIPSVLVLLNGYQYPRFSALYRN